MTAQQIIQTRPISLASVSILAAGNSPQLKTPVAMTPEPEQPNGEIEAAFIVLGRDEAGKAHASWFDAADRPAAEAAARAMGFAGLCAAADGVRELAGNLPRGRVFASGRAFVPFVRASLYEHLLTHLPEGAVEAARAAAKANAAENPAPADGSKPAASYAEASGKEERPDWKKLKKGDLVLATLGGDEPWYPAIIVDEKSNGLVEVRWRDYADDPNVIRRREHLALLHPDCPV